jgi:pantetheine-phosphate adenylyltransferase
MFHDIIYYPGYDGNESKSEEVFRELCWVSASTIANEIADAILATKDHKATNELGRHFCRIDMDVLDADPVEMLEWEKGIFKEYQRFSVSEYIKGRLGFLYGHVDEHPKLRFLIDYLEHHFRPRVAIYAGSFNPFHVGHMNILEKAERMFDKVVLAEGRNPEKKDDRPESYLDGHFPFHEVVQFECLLPELVRAYSEHANVTVVKGLRNGYDLNYEMNQLRFMQDYNSDINVVYIACDSEFEHISSSALRGIKSFDVHIHKYLPHKYDYFVK